MTRERLLRLYPRAWRERYGDEFLATVEQRSLHVADRIDIMSGAIDAWLSPDVRRMTAASRGGSGQGGYVLLKSLMACEANTTGVTPRDGLIGAAVMIGASFLFKALAAAARPDFPAASAAIQSLAFVGPFTLSMPFWLMKGQSWKAQSLILGGTFVALVLAGFLRHSG
jgi:hypothetical protein